MGKKSDSASAVPAGLLGLPDLSSILPPNIADAIKNVTSGIIDGTGHEVGSPQPADRPIPTTNDKELNGAVKAIDAVLTAIDVLQKFNALIPDEYEPYIQKLEDALKTVRGWLD